MKKNIKRNLIVRKGFALIEVVITISIFSMLMVSFAEIFGSAMNNSVKIKNFQKNTESAQFSINEMAKVFRTSAIVSQDPTSVQVMDHSQENCVKYQISGGKLQRAMVNLAGSASQVTDCTSKVFVVADFVDLISASVSGSFTAVPSDDTAGSEKAGKVTILLNIQKTASDFVKLQTTVSLRSFNK